MEEAATPFPREETTPPVTKIYFGAILAARDRDFPPATCMPSSGLTYGQLSSEVVRVSNRGKAVVGRFEEHEFDCWTNPS